jgi:ATP-dependent Clp protease ATP-binding subunit ClpC
MLWKFDKNAAEAIFRARQFASPTIEDGFASVHLLLGLLHNTQWYVAQLLESFGVNIQSLHTHLWGEVSAPLTYPELAEGTNSFLADLYDLALSETQVDSVIAPEDLLLAIMQMDKTRGAIYLEQWGMPDVEIVRDKVAQHRLRASINVRRPAASDQKLHSSKFLREFGVDLVRLAKEGKLHAARNREAEIQKAIRTLGRHNKQNVILIGDPGVGKTNFVETLALRIAQGAVPEHLANKLIFTIEIGMLVAGTRYRGEFEERVQGILKDARSLGNVILFFDEAHMLIGAGNAEGAVDAANILKPALASGEFQCIAATTVGEYRRFFEKDAAMVRRFQPLLLDAPSADETIEILQSVAQRLEDHHGLKISGEAIEAAVRLSERYITERAQPDKSIDLLDEGSSGVRMRANTWPPRVKDLEEQIDSAEKRFAEAKASGELNLARTEREAISRLSDELNNLKLRTGIERSLCPATVTRPDIELVVSELTGIPANQLSEHDSRRLIDLELALHEEVIGQDEAVRLISSAIRRGRVGLSDPNSPVGSFLCLGPTGVGKTQLAKAVARFLFGSEQALVRIDMSEFAEKHTISRLIGAPPGYVGYAQEGVLTEAVRRKPYSVILFDEIEKAHPDVWNLLLQILGDGRLTDNKGRTVDFKNTVVIMTSNVGARSILRPTTIGLHANQSTNELSQTDIKRAVMKEVSRTFSPELINRFDEIVVFEQLDNEQIRQIVNLRCSELRSRCLAKGFDLVISDDCKKLLSVKGFDPQFGARPLKRVIQKLLADPLAVLLLEKSFSEVDCVEATVEANSIVFRPRSSKEDKLETLSEN